MRFIHNKRIFMFKRLRASAYVTRSKTRDLGRCASWRLQTSCNAIFFYLTPPFPNKKRRGPQYCRQLRTCSHRSIKICSSGAQVNWYHVKGSWKMPHDGPWWICMYWYYASGPRKNIPLIIVRCQTFVHL